jgi:hypothetical protein
MKSLSPPSGPTLTYALRYCRSSIDLKMRRRATMFTAAGCESLLIRGQPDIMVRNPNRVEVRD